jgi:hypothetical protein
MIGGRGGCVGRRRASGGRWQAGGRGAHVCFKCQTKHGRGHVWDKVHPMYDGLI